MLMAYDRHVHTLSAHRFLLSFANAVMRAAFLVPMVFAVGCSAHGITIHVKIFYVANSDLSRRKTFLAVPRKFRSFSSQIY